jgi:hypothetical protein
MQNIRLVRAGVVALAMMLGCTEGLAKGNVTAPLVDYNSAQVAVANGTVTVPFGALLANAVYTVSAGTQAQINSFFTVTLPSGFKFVTTPTLTGTGVTLSLNSGGIGSNSSVYKITGGSIAAGGTISVGSFEVAGATALASQFSSNTLAMTFQSTGNTTSSNNDTAPVSVPVFQHAVGSLPDTITPGSGLINTGSSPPATLFVANGATIATSGQVATFAINTELNDPFNSNAPVLSPNGLANSLNPADTTNITIEGNFSGIAKAYADPTVTTCASTVPGGSITGTVTSGSLTFNSVPINTPVQICMIPGGVSQLVPSTNPFVYTYAAGSGVTDFFGGLSQTTAGNFYSYGGPPLPQVTFSPSAIPPDGVTTSLMTVTIVNPAQNSFALNLVAFSNTLPNGFKLVSVVNDGCGGGSFSATGFSEANVNLALGASCAVQVNVVASFGTGVGTYVDTTSTVTSFQDPAGGPGSGAITVTTDPIFTLTVAETGAGSGTVTSSPSGINCSSTSNQCASGFASGTPVTLSAVPTPLSSTFTGWSGAGCSGIGTCVITVSQAQSAVIANFAQVTYPLSITESGSGSGQVTSNPSGINCSSTSNQCSSSFTGGTAVTLTASAASGSAFAGWSGGGCSGTASCVTTMNQAQNVTATFTQIPSFTLSVATAGNGSGTITSSPSGINCGGTCNASYQTGTQVTLSAAAASGSTFAGWSGGGCGGDQVCTVTLAANTTVTANFVQNSAGNLTLVAAVLPLSRSVQLGATPTAFATMINTGPDTGSTCTITPATSIPASFLFQTTDPATNALTGSANTPVNIAAGAAQSFVIAFTPTAAFAPTNVAFTFTCANASPVATLIGINTLNLSASTTPVPDIVALAASGDPGYVDIPGATGTGVFAVATVNLGVDATITASANTGTANLPITLLVCQTNPATGACLATPAPNATTDVPANATPTFGVFATGSAAVADMPGVNRVFVTFTDNNGTLRGETSVAVRTH